MVRPWRQLERRRGLIDFSTRCRRVVSPPASNSVARNSSSPSSQRVFAFNRRRFVIIATDSQPPCCISSFLPPRSPLFRRHLPPLPFSFLLAHVRVFFLSPSFLSSPSFLLLRVPRPLFVQLSSVPLALCRPSLGASAFPFHRQPSFSSREHLLFASVLLPLLFPSIVPLPSPLSLFASSFNLHPLFYHLLLLHAWLFCHALSFFDARARCARTSSVYSRRFPRVRRAQARTQTRTPYAVLTENLPSPLHPRLGNMAASVAQLEEACACARRLQYH